MATATVVISGGGTVTAAKGWAVVLGTGAGLGIGAVPWNTSNASRKSVDWLPAPTHAIGTCPSCKTRIPMDTLWYRFFRELSENRMGGKHGSTIPQVVTTVAQTQSQVVATASYTEQAVAYTRGVAATAEATAQVAQDSGLDGADTIPPAPEPPTRPTSGTSAL